MAFVVSPSTRALSRTRGKKATGIQSALMSCHQGHEQDTITPPISRTSIAGTPSKNQTPPTKQIQNNHTQPNSTATNMQKTTKPPTKPTTTKPQPKTYQHPKPKQQTYQPPTPQLNNWISRSVQNSVASLGSVAGSAVYMLGNGINAAGRSVGNGIAGATSGISSNIQQYGNTVKDATKAQGPRAPTAKNPLGLASTAGGARAQMKFGGQKKQIGGSAGNPLGL